MATPPRKPWIEPHREDAVPTFTTRAIRIWSEQIQEQVTTFSRSAFTMMQPTSKSKPKPSNYGQDSVLDNRTECELQSMPRFKRVRFAQPKSMKSGEEEKRRNVIILSRPGIQLVRLQKQQIQFVISNSCDKGALQSMLQTP